VTIISKRDRYRGALVGVLAGDALGAPYEWTWTPERIAEDMRARGGLVPHEYEPFDYIEPFKGKRTVTAGQPTDDSELAAALAQSLVAHPEFDAMDLYGRLRSFIHLRKSILTTRAYGSGSTLSAALKPEIYQDSLSQFAYGEMPTPPSNGGLMRCTPAGLRYPGEGIKAAELGRAQSRVTHRHPQSQAACAAYAATVSFVVAELSPSDAWIAACGLLHSASHDDQALAEVLSVDLSKPDYERDILGKDDGVDKKGWAVLSLRAALWAAINAKDFADGIVKVISLGGDTDTYGAIAGGILGAHFGIQGIPEKWQGVLQGREVMIDLADRLYEGAHL